MRIGIYQEYWGWIGGGQMVAAAIAEILSRGHDVDLLHHRDDFDRAPVEEALGVDLSRVRFRLVPAPERPATTSWNPLRRLRLEQEWCSELSRPYEMFINSTDQVPAFCHAPRGVLLTFFPFTDQDGFHGRRDERWRRRSWPARVALRAYHDLEWWRRYASYRRVVTCSEFSRYWLKRRWRVDARVLYPAVRQRFARRGRTPTILSVARFQDTALGHHKKHPVLVDAFRSLCDGGLQGWRLVLAGGLRETAQNLAYVESLRRRAEGYPIDICPNVTGHGLANLYETATVFWHAAGYGEDERDNPGRMEHFGIVTLEAMAAGCVPVVYAGGGQPEIVADREHGRLWSTRAELERLTRDLVAEPDTLAAMSDAARARAGAFSSECFERNLYRVLEMAP